MKAIPECPPWNRRNKATKRYSYALCNKEIARAKTGIAFFNYKENKIVAVPEKFKKLISQINSSDSQVELD